MMANQIGFSLPSIPLKPHRALLDTSSRALLPSKGSSYRRVARPLGERFLNADAALGSRP